MDLTNLKELLTEDDAVSPVIGVILMVAITVILAAVIASFVLGLGDTASQATPQASFSFDYDSSVGNDTSGAATITHDGGDTIEGNELYIRGDGLIDDPTSASWGFSSGDFDYDGNSDNWETATSTSEVTAGNSIVAAAEDDYNLRVIYETQEGDNSATLAQDTGPEA